MKKTVITEKTPFEQAQEQVANKEMKTPSVSVGDKHIDYFAYQLSVHHFNLKLMEKGMTFRGIKFTDIKKYYGLTGRNKKDCLDQFEKILEDYKRKMNLLNSVNGN